MNANYSHLQEQNFPELSKLGHFMQIIHATEPVVVLALEFRDLIQSSVCSPLQYIFGPNQIELFVFPVLYSLVPDLSP